MRVARKVKTFASLNQAVKIAEFQK